MHAPFHENVSYFVNVNVKTAIAKRLSFSSVLDVSVSGTVCSLIITILHSLDLLANYRNTIQLISIPKLSLLKYDYMTCLREH